MIELEITPEAFAAHIRKVGPPGGFGPGRPGAMPAGPGFPPGFGAGSLHTLFELLEAK
jgi:hypothetical protein